MDRAEIPHGVSVRADGCHEVSGGLRMVVVTKAWMILVHHEAAQGKEMP